MRHVENDKNIKRVGDRRDPEHHYWLYLIALKNLKGF